jgi:hypothetical protein
MWYTAASVITAVRTCGELDVADGTHCPACPKGGNNIHCLSDFPECEGKTTQCRQELRLVDARGNPATLCFEYYVSRESRDGRIKKKNSTLLLLMRKYRIDGALMVSL